MVTPNFPEYTSGHSTFSAAAAAVLDSFFGTNVSFSDTTAGFTHSFANFDQAAIEAGRSRIYGGIHFEFSDADAEAAGRLLGNYVVGTFAVSSDQQAPKIDDHRSQVDAVLAGNTTITGQVFDNLSGVAKRTALDGSAYANVSYAVSGNFSLPTAFTLNGGAKAFIPTVSAPPMRRATSPSRLI